MRVTLVYGASTREVTVERTMDGRRNRLVIGCGWRQPPAEVYRLAAPYLTAAERTELAIALGLKADTPGPEVAHNT